MNTNDAARAAAQKRSTSTPSSKAAGTVLLYVQ